MMLWLLLLVVVVAKNLVHFGFSGLLLLGMLLITLELGVVGWYYTVLHRNGRWCFLFRLRGCVYYLCCLCWWYLVV